MSDKFLNSRLEVLDGLIASFCIEFLRYRRMGSFNVIEVIAIAALLMLVKGIILEVRRTQRGDKTSDYPASRRSRFKMQSRDTQMGDVGSSRSRIQISRRRWKARTPPKF